MCRGFSSSGTTASRGPACGSNACDGSVHRGTYRRSDRRSPRFAASVQPTGCDELRNTRLSRWRSESIASRHRRPDARGLRPVRGTLNRGHRALGWSGCRLPRYSFGRRVGAAARPSPAALLNQLAAAAASLGTSMPTSYITPSRSCASASSGTRRCPRAALNEARGALVSGIRRDNRQLLALAADADQPPRPNHDGEDRRARCAVGPL